MAKEVKVRAPAKVNVALLVGAARLDGYHPVETLYLALSLSDELRLTRAPGLEIAISGRATGVPAGPGNLAWRAAAALAQEAGITPGARIEITKLIPVAGGLAGGSADAAGALVGLNELWGLGFGRQRLEHIAATLGSDVPFSVRGGCAIGRDRGTELESVPVAAPLHWVILNPGGELSTASAYRHFDERTGGRAPAGRLPDELLVAMRAGDTAGISRHMVNDLQADALAVRPGLGSQLAAMEQAGLRAIVSGSGPTLAGLAPGPEAAAAACASLAAAFPAALVVQATGPVAGARVIGSGH